MNRVQTRSLIPSREDISNPVLIPDWTILPLRLFLGVSFVSAGFDKLTDPAFLDPLARNYIGNQIALFAPVTPLEGFLTNVAVPNASAFGLLVMGGELMIGLAVLIGALTRFSAVMGLFINLTFFLSATWQVHPFYFGADLPYAVAWLTLALTGPGPFALDLFVKRWLDGNAPRESPVPGGAGEKAFTRRAILSAGAGGLTVAGIAGTGLAWMLLHPGSSTTTASTPSATTTPEAPSAGKPPAVAAPQEDSTPTAQPTNTPAQSGQTFQPSEPAATDAPAPADTGGKQLLAAPGELPQGQAAEFQLPTGEPAVLVHNDAGYSAYVAICTHEGCQVRPVSGGLLACPCHGAEFDPGQSGRAVRGPARRPLSAIAITVGPDGSVYLDE